MKCKKHPRYKGKNKEQAKNCPACICIYMNRLFKEKRERQ
jgi:hypothetical protein